MPKATTAIRMPVNKGQRIANSVVTIEAATPAARASVRATPRGAKAYEKTLGFALPGTPSSTAKKAGRHALWLGPDEWLVIDEKNVNAALVPKTANKEMAATDISHRNCAFVVSGHGAANVLNAGCPRDLSVGSFPVNTASRTVLGRAEVVLYRTARDTFRVECWRTFAPYVWAYLQDGAKDAHV